MIEIPNHRYFVGAQFHPEFKSRPSKPSPLFVGKMLSDAENSALVHFTSICAVLFHRIYHNQFYVSAGLIAAASGQLDRVLQDRCNGHVGSAKHVRSNGSYTSAVHQNGNPKKLTNGLSNGTYYANGNGVHA
jgi:CTP synthase